MALKPVKLSKKLELVGVPRYTPVKGVKDYGFICDPQKYEVALHYEDGLGTFQCFDGSCCEKLGDSRMSHVYLVAFYQGNERKHLRGPLTIKHIRASYALDNYIRGIIEDLDNEADICLKDFAFTLDESSGEQYKKISMSLCADGKRVATPEMVKEVEDKLPHAIEKLSNSVAPEWNEEIFAVKWKQYCDEKGISETSKSPSQAPDKGEVEIDDSGDLEEELVDELSEDATPEIGEQTFDDIELGDDIVL